MSLFVLLLLPFLGSLLTAFMPTRARTLLASVAGIVAAVAAAWILSLFTRVRDGGVIRETIAWVPSLGIDLVLRVDGFAWMFALIITVIGVLVCLYARYYMSPDDPVGRFYALFLPSWARCRRRAVGQSAAAGRVLGAHEPDLVPLIGFWHHRVDAQRGARMALIVTGRRARIARGGHLLATSSAVTTSMQCSPQVT